MNKARLPILIIVVSLLLTAFIALQALADTGGYASIRAGMGDLQRFEAQKALANPGGNASSPAGMGDLQRFEVQKVLTNPGGYVTGRSGMGDLQRFESLQISANTDASTAQAHEPVCPGLSTSNGERDAGASAPTNVLLAMGCTTPTLK